MSSCAERRFAVLWDNLYPSVDLVSEYRFHPERRWRFDFAHLPSMTAVEVEGGIWNGGRHTTGAGFTRDCEKYNSATLLGWAVVRLTPQMITVPHLDNVAELIERRALWLSVSSPN